MDAVSSARDSAKKLLEQLDDIESDADDAHSEACAEETYDGFSKEMGELLAAYAETNDVATQKHIARQLEQAFRELAE